MHSLDIAGSFGMRVVVDEKDRSPHNTRLAPLRSWVELVYIFTVLNVGSKLYMQFLRLLLGYALGYP